MKSFFKIFSLAVLFLFFILLSAQAVSAASNACDAKYPQSGECQDISVTPCTEASHGKPVVAVSGLCPGGKNIICCVYKEEADAAAASSQSSAGSKPGGCKTTGNQTVCTLDNPLGAKGPTGVPQIVGNLIKAALGIIGALTLLMFVWGGFLWMTSGGSPERVKKGSQTMFWAAIGVALVFASYLVLSTFTTWLETGKVPGA